MSAPTSNSDFFPVYSPRAPMQQIATDVVTAAVVIPTALVVGLTVLYRFHRAWCWLRSFFIAADPDNWIQLGAGRAASFAFGDNIPLRVAALMVWIPSRLVECVDRYHLLERDWQKLVGAVRNDFDYSEMEPWEYNWESTFSPSQEILVKHKGCHGKIYCQRVAYLTALVAYRFWSLSMTCVDTYKAVSMDKATCDRAMNAFFLDGINAIDKIAQQREVVLLNLEENRVLINQFLKLMGSNCTADVFIDSLSAKVNMIAEVNEGIQKVKNLGNGLLKDLGRHAILSAYSLFGKAEYLPERFKPGQWEEDMFEVQPSQQYIPEELLIVTEDIISGIEKHTQQKKKISGKRVH